MQSTGWDLLDLAQWQQAEAFIPYSFRLQISLETFANLNEISGTDGRIFIKAQQKQAAHQDSAIENAIEHVGRSAGRRM